MYRIVVAIIFKGVMHDGEKLREKIANGMLIQYAVVCMHGVKYRFKHLILS